MSNISVALNFIELVLEKNLFSPQGLAPSLHAPESIQGLSSELLKDDLNYLLVQWFIDALKPQNSEENNHYPHIYQSVRKALRNRFIDSSDPELHKVSTRLSRLICNGSNQRKYQREEFSIADKFSLFTKSGGYCGICGFRFSEAMVENFLGGQPQYSKHIFYDFLKPTKRTKKNFQIEIDHIFPLARGGGNDLENLQLLCGFCNSAKRDFTSVFDSSSKTIEINHPELGKLNLSSWFLVVRVLSGNKCSFCDKSIDSTELTITPLLMSYQINPVNVRSTCYECDPMKEYRFLPVE